MFNRATLIGNVGKAPEVRVTKNGTKIANLTLATSERWTDKKSGEKREETEWHSIVIFNDRLVDLVEKYVTKGSKLMVEGKIVTEKWEDQKGDTRYSTKIHLKFDGVIKLLSSKQDGQGAAERQPGEDDGAPAGEPPPQSKAPASNASAPRNKHGLIDDEIPF